VRGTEDGGEGVRGAGGGPTIANLPPHPQHFVNDDFDRVIDEKKQIVELGGSRATVELEGDGGGCGFFWLSPHTRASDSRVSAKRNRLRNT